MRTGKRKQTRFMQIQSQLRITNTATKLSQINFAICVNGSSEAAYLDHVIIRRRSKKLCRGR